jgi:hypothetical protein
MLNLMVCLNFQTGEHQRLRFEWQTFGPLAHDDSGRTFRPTTHHG